MNSIKQRIRVGHSPDPDDAFMFHALANHKIDTGDYEFTHELVDIETLNQRAFAGELELTAVSIHAYGHLADKYVLCSCGASMGDNYGPIVVARRPLSLAELPSVNFAVPGKLTSAFLALRLFLNTDFCYTLVPFDEILNAVACGDWQGRQVDAGLVIHEGQLTFAASGLQRIVDLGRWWKQETDLPLPLGANAVRRDLGPQTIGDVTRLLRQSIAYGLAHRQEALDYALQYGRDLNRGQADEFVSMYVNDWTMDFGPRGQAAVAELLQRGHACGLLPKLIQPEFV